MTTSLSWAVGSVQVVVWRPLLELSKDAIFDFAHRYGVPYFKVRLAWHGSDGGRQQ